MKEPYIYTIVFNPKTKTTGIWPFRKTETVLPKFIEIEASDFELGLYLVTFYGKNRNTLFKATFGNEIRYISSRENT